MITKQYLPKAHLRLLSFWTITIEKHRNKGFILLFCFFLNVSLAQNLIDSSDWGNGISTSSLLNYINNGPTSNTFLENGVDPFGNPATLWRVDSKLGEAYTRHYGFKTKVNISSQVDPNIDYRYTVWVKMLGTDASDITQYGTLSAGLNGVNGYKFISSNGSDITQFQWKSGGNIPSNVINDEWFLLVAYVKGSGSQTILDDGGLYDMESAVPVGSLAPGSVEFNATNTPYFELFTHLRFNPTTNSNNLQSLVFFDPRFEKVDGAVPIDQLRGIGSGQSQSVWNYNDSDINYVDGNVGIGTASVPSGYKLAVEGKIRTREVRVDQDTWPDYVFKEEYHLPSLEEIQKHIKEKGHLINIPSAKEVAKNGVELGEMNKLLLEKIEELTLYILKQEKKQKLLKQILETQEQRILKLENN